MSVTRNGSAAAFSPRTILALVLVGIVSFSGLAVLSAYAPDLRGGSDARAHALSSSAIGFRGAVIMLKAEGVPVLISRGPPVLRGGVQSLMVATPQLDTTAKDMKAFAGAERLLIVLPKWEASPDPVRSGFVIKDGLVENSNDATDLLTAYAPDTQIHRRAGPARPILGAAGVFPQGLRLPLGAVDRLQTLAGDGWAPALVDEEGRMVLAQSRRQPGVLVLADPDLLNTQGLASLDTARAGMAILSVMRGRGGVRFDVTLDGFVRGRGIGRMMLEPPWLAATLCAVAAAMLMGVQALARFGPTLVRGRDVALGKRALVDNSAGLVRMARKEPEFAGPYAAVTADLIRRASGGAARAGGEGDDPHWLAEVARLRGAAAPADLFEEAGRAKTRADLLAVGRKLYHWRLEITRGRH